MSASAKGYAVDILYKNLRFSGYSNLLIEIGGEIKASGLNFTKKIWTLGLSVPNVHNLFGQSIKLFNITEIYG